jgi:hypothetical protein
MRIPARKIASISLSLIYFTTQVALGAVAESNFWKERRKTFRNADLGMRNDKNPTGNPQSEISNPKYASLPLQLPPLNAVSPTSTWSNANKKISTNLSAPLKKLADAIPFTYGSIQDAYAPSSPKGGYDVTSPPVLLLQDVHLNAEAQNNLAAILQELINQKQISMVGVEGAFNKFDFAPFRSVANRNDITKKLLEDNRLAAPSFVGINSPVEPPLFIGIDDIPHYEANAQAYLDSRPLKEKVTSALHALEQNLNEEKKT